MHQRPAFFCSNTAPHVSALGCPSHFQYCLASKAPKDSETQKTGRVGERFRGWEMAQDPGAHASYDSFQKMIGGMTSDGPRLEFSPLQGHIPSSPFGAPRSE